MIRFAQRGDHPQLKSLWAEAFGDPPDAVDAYFRLRHKDENMLLDARDGMVRGMLSMLPVTLAANGGQDYPARYIYAVATDKQVRRQGIGTALLEAAHAHMQSLGEAAAVLAPAAPDLFDYYQKRDYQTVFSINVLSVSAADLPPMPPQAEFHDCGAPEYTRVRDLAFQSSRLYIRWTEDAVAYAVTTFEKPGGVTTLRWDGGYGCAAWEQIQGGVLVRELALPQGDVQTALAVLHAQLHAGRYTVRLAEGTVSGAAPRPFGMIHWLIPKPALTGAPPYLSLAMD